MRKLLLLVLVGLVGCSKTDEFPTLESGTEAIVIWEKAFLSSPELSEKLDLFCSVTEGTLVRVIADPGFDPKVGPFRPVRVRVLEGPETDQVGTVERNAIKPIKRQ
jgi:hypothetical protein